MPLVSRAISSFDQPPRSSSSSSLALSSSSFFAMAAYFSRVAVLFDSILSITFVHFASTSDKSSSGSFFICSTMNSNCAFTLKFFVTVPYTQNLSYFFDPGIFSMHSSSSTLSSCLITRSFDFFSALAASSMSCLALAYAWIASSFSRIAFSFASRNRFFSLNFSSFIRAFSASISASSLMISGWCFLAFSTNLKILARSSLR